MITQMERFKRLLGQECSVNWAKVFVIEFSRILNYFRFHGVEDSAAEDLTASTFEKAWRARESYSGQKSTVSTWLYSIARHAMIDYFRALKDELPLEALDGRYERQMNDTPEETALHSDERERLRQALFHLPEREREVVALKYGAEMTNRDIAKQTGLSETNVGTILNRVVQSLRSQMEKER